MDKNKILDYHLVKKKIRRISLQIIESNSIDDEIIIAGIENNGYIIAKKICNEIKKISDKKIQLCGIKIDKKNPRKEITVSLVEEQYKNKSVVIVDDVLNSGSTLMYAVKYFLDTKLKKLKTAVLVDRNHKKYPIKADYKGLSLSTSIQNHVEVSINDNEINRFLVSKKNLELLWNICQIPDFEKLFNDNYLLLLKEIHLIFLKLRIYYL